MTETANKDVPIQRRASFRAESSQLANRIEEALLKSTAPLQVNESELTNIDGHRGILLNKAEILNWHGPVPLEQYRLNHDPNPEVIRRQLNQPIEYNQDISVRYLRPPTPVTGELIIRQEQESVSIPAPPVIIRKIGDRAATPPPIVIREVPPEVPSIDRKVITVTSGKVNEYPARRVITEIVPPLPPKPPQVIIEKWIPYPKQRRRVVYEGARTRSTTLTPQRNLVINWEQQPTVVKKGIRYLGVTTADPADYRARYGSSLRHPTDMPTFVKDYERVSKLQSEDIKYSKDLVVDNLETTIHDRGYRSYNVPEVHHYHVNEVPLATTYSTERVVERVTNPSATVVSSGAVFNPNVQIEYFGDLEALRLLDQATLEREGLTNYVRTSSIKL